jgi:thiamine biosynthesis lipoprotein
VSTASTAAGVTALPAMRALRLEQPRRAFVAQLMGLPVSVHVRGPQATGPAVAALVQQLFLALAADEATFSTYRADSTVSAIRRGELRVEHAGTRAREVAALCDEASRRTAGAFSAWLPGPDGSPAFEPTGLVKGWAVQQAFDALVERLVDLGPHDALVNAGGDIAVACARTDTPDWRIAIEDPRDRTRTLRVESLRTGAVATSGTAARGAHILDPATGSPAHGLLAATVVGPSLLWADVYATAAFVHGTRAVGWLRDLPTYRADLVAPDGSITRVIQQA